MSTDSHNLLKSVDSVGMEEGRFAQGGSAGCLGFCAREIMSASLVEEQTGCLIACMPNVKRMQGRKHQAFFGGGCWKGKERGNDGTDCPKLGNSVHVAFRRGLGVSRSIEGSPHHAHASNPEALAGMHARSSQLIAYRVTRSKQCGSFALG